MNNTFLILLGKCLSKLITLFRLGNGSTWPGHIALKQNPHFVRDILTKSKSKIILIAGTNGKTTTAKLIQTALEKSGKRVLQNDSGANLVNGIASALLLQSSLTGKLPYDFAIFEVDENTLSPLLKELNPDFVVLLNLFRDQLDRYGEVNTIIYRWKEALSHLSKNTTLILNADDPQIAYLGHGLKTETVYFGLQSAQYGKDKVQHAADSVYCPKCGTKLTFAAIAFSHLGDWKCPKCGLKRPESEQEKFTIYPLPGLYNKYNVLAALATLKRSGLDNNQIQDAFTEFTPAFGRQEIIVYQERHIQIFLSKNPTSFNQSYQTIQELGGHTLLLVLNDRIPDGRDVSWIWDIELPQVDQFKQILIAGDRVYDMALRIKYENYKNFQTFESVADAIDAGIKHLEKDETLFILPTYSAMLEVRKIITGKKIL